MNMSKTILFEVLETSKKDLNEYLKTLGYSGKYIEKLEIHFHPNGDVSFVKPTLRF